MALGNYYVEPIQLEISPLSRNVVPYYDDTWEVHLSNILADDASAFILSPLSIEPLEVLFENEIVDLNKGANEYSNKFGKCFQPRIFNTIKSNPHISPITSNNNITTTKRKSGGEASSKRRTKIIRNNKKEKVTLHKSQVSLFFQRQRKYHSVKRYIDETDDMIRFGVFAGDVDRRHEICPMNRINCRSTSTKSHINCVCRSFVLRKTSLSQEIHMMNNYLNNV